MGGCYGRATAAMSIAAAGFRTWAENEGTGQNCGISAGTALLAKPLSL